MFRAAIIYAPADGLIKEAAAKIKDSIDGQKYSVTTLEAAGAAIPDLVAFDLVIFGSTGEGPHPIHPDFTKLLRALEGVNLAGRVAAVFGPESRKTLTAFKKALQDSEITLKEDNLFFIDGPREPEKRLIKAWLKNLTDQLEAIRHDW